MFGVFLIDGAFFGHKLRQAGRTIGAPVVAGFAAAVCGMYPGYELLRTYYYDCPPSDEKTLAPVTRTAVDFKTNAQYKIQTRLLADLKRTDYVSVREGRLYFRGWVLKEGISPTSATPLRDIDYKPDFEQKGVDIKIGLDMAWISMGHIAQRIYLVTGDSDFIPAMKFARRSGVQVFLFTLGHGVFPDLMNHADVLNRSPVSELLPPSVIASSV